MLIWSSQEISFGCELKPHPPAIESFCLKGRANQKKVGQSFEVYILMMKSKPIILGLNNNVFWGKIFSCFLFVFLYFSNWTFLSPHAKTLQNTFQQTEMTYFAIKESGLVITRWGFRGFKVEELSLIQDREVTWTWNKQNCCPECFDFFLAKTMYVNYYFLTFVYVCYSVAIEPLKSRKSVQVL